jgi:steroid 5-alpha reductase family enzyme
MAHLFLTLIVAVVLMSALWPLSLALKDVSIVDVVWGPGFAVLGWFVFWAEGGMGTRGLVALGLVTLWGARLGLHLLARRIKSGKEDHRYTIIRRKFGPYFPIFSLVLVFWLQGFLLWLISWPVQAAVAAPGAPAPLDMMGWSLTLCGIIIEAFADRQLKTFRAQPHHQDRVLDTGLWRWTRHPNYFGDFLIWWGFFVAGIAAGAPWWTIASPVVMSALLIRFSGAGLMEETITGRRPAYRAYIARTSIFFPWPPARD